MDKEKKNRSGSVSNENRSQKGRKDAKQSHQPGAPNKSNRQTGGHEKDESHGAKKNTTKKQQNSI